MNELFFKFSDGVWSVLYLAAGVLVPILEDYLPVSSYLGVFPVFSLFIILAFILSLNEILSVGCAF